MYTENMDITYKEVETINEFIDAIRIRVDVFIIEQKFQPGWEPGEEDKNARHLIAIMDGKVVSTARIREVSDGEIKIERMATKKEYRGVGIGKGLINCIIKKIKRLKSIKIWMEAQVQAQNFYEKCGFKAVSKPHDLHGVAHITMEYSR